MKVVANSVGLMLVFLFSMMQFDALLAQPCSSITTIKCGSANVFSVNNGAGDVNFPNGVNTSCYYNSGRGGLEKIYKFVAPSTGLYQFGTTSASSNSSMVEYFYANASNACSNAGTGWSCLGYSSIATPLTSFTMNAGDSILILANAESNAGVSQSFQIGCDIGFPCDNISTINCGSPTSVSIAAGYGHPNFPNGVNTSCYYNSGRGGLEKIYKFVAPSTGLYQFGTTSVSSNGSMVEYFYTNASNGCNNVGTGWTCLGFTSSATPLTSFTLNAGDSILILANAESNAGVSQSFQISCAIGFPCDNITSITCGSPTNISIAAGYGHPNFPNGVNTSCYNNSGRGGLEKIYKFIAPSTGLYQFGTTTASSNGSVVEYFYNNASNGCNNTSAGWSCLGYSASAIPLTSFTMNAGDSILILANAESNAGVSQSFQINCAIGFPCDNITNINCGNPVSFSVNAGFGHPNFANGLNTSCYNNSGRGGLEKIYKFVAPNTGLYQFGTTSASSNGSVVEYFYTNASNGCNNVGTGWTCLGYSSSAVPLTSFTLNAGDSILILANAESNSGVSQSFQISCAIGFPCDNISNISCGSPTNFSIAAGYGHPNFPNGVNTSCYNNSGRGGLEKIYRFIAPNSGLYQFSTTTASSNGSVVEYFYTNAINGCNNVGTGWTCLGYSSRAVQLTSFTLNAGDSILILVNAESNAGVSQSFEISCAIGFPCDNITTISCGSPVNFSVGSGFGHPNFFNGLNTSCYNNSGRGGLEKIYKFVAPSTGLYQFSTTSASSNSSVVEYFYTKDINGCNNTSTGWSCLGYTTLATPLTSFTLNAGDSIYILVNAESSSGVSQSFQISCATPFPCDDISSINCGDTTTFKVGAGYGLSDYYNGAGTGCYKNTGRGGLEKIYRFVAPLSGYYRLETTSPATFSSYVGYFYRKSNTCGGAGWNCFGYTWTSAKLDSVFLNYKDTLLLLVNAESIGGISQSFKLNCATTFCANSPITKSTNLSGCGSVVYNGITYNKTTTLRDTIRTTKGCDSIYNVVTIAVTASPTPSIVIAADRNNISVGTKVQFTTTVQNEGTSPAYQWKKNSTNVGTGAAYSSATLADGDTLWCVLTSSLSCASPSVISSNKIVMQVANTVPTITSFAPLKAKIGDTLVLKGKNFGTNPSKSIVYLGAVKATVVLAADTLLKVIVPVGAGYAPPSVLVNGLSAQASLPFNPIFAAATKFQPYSFEPKIDSVLNNDLTELTSCDFDGDGKVDVFEVGSTSAFLLRNTSSVAKIGFSAKQTLVNYGVRAKLYLNIVNIEDVDGDGKKDILLGVTYTQFTGFSVLYFKNKSTAGQLQFDSSVTLFGGFNTLYALNSADIDGDGRRDVVVTTNGYVHILRNTTLLDSAATFDTYQYVIAPSNSNSLRQSKIADVNLDGKPDLLVLDADLNKIRVYANNCSVGDVTNLILQYYNANTTSLTTGDFNNDSKIDIATVGGVGLAMLKNITTNAFYTAFDTTRVYNAGVNITVGESADMNGDGNPDLVLSGWINSLSGFRVLVNNNSTGAITFDTGRIYIANPTTTAPVQSTTADFDGDGVPDVATGIVNTTASVAFFRSRINQISINSFSPTRAVAGTTVTINGYNLGGVTTVSFGGVAAASFTVVNDSTITALVGNGASGSVSISAPYGAVANAGFVFCPSPVNQSISLSGCNAVAYKGKTYSTNTTVADTLLTIYGCDSVYLSVSIKVNKIIPVAQNITVNGCKTVTYKGITYTANTVVKDTVKSYQGCDSVFVTATIVVNNTAPIVQTQTVTGCLSVVYNSVIYLNSTLLTDTLKSVQGCDSVYKQVNIVIAQANVPSITVSATATVINQGQSVTFTALAVNKGPADTYQWYKNAAPIAGATDSFYTTTGLQNNDIVYVLLKSSSPCFLNGTYSSNTLVITVNAAQYTLSGSVKNPQGKVIPNVIVSLNGSSPQTVSGNYSYNVAPNGNYSIKVSKNNDVVKSNGVSALDILNVQGHILNKLLFNSPFKIIAADVNNDGSVTTIDILFIKRLILGIDSTFKGNRLWAFVDSSYAFPSSTNPFPYKDSISFANLSANQAGQSFIGVKLGDVNFNWDPATLGTTRTTTQTVELVYQVAATHTDELRIPIKVNHFQSILGMQYTMNYNQSAWQLTGVENNRLNIDYGTAHLSEGKVSFLWTDEKLVAQTLADSTELLTLVFKKIGNQPEAQLRLSSDVTVIEAWDAAYQRHDVVLKAATKPADQFIAHESYMVSPNPTDGKVVLQLNLSTAKPLQVVLTDANGRMVYQQKINATKGSSRVALDFKKDQPLTAGNYYLQVNGLEGENTQKLLVK